MDDFVNLLDPENIGSGIGEYIWIAPFYWFAAGGIKKPAPGTIIIEDDYEFLPGKGFVKLLLAPRKNQYEVATKGDIGLNGLEHTLTVFIPGSYAELHEQAKNLLNTPFVVLFYDANCPVELVYSLGINDSAAWFELDFSTGFTHEGNKGYLGTVKTDQCSVLFYEGVIAEVPVGDLFLYTEDGQPVLTEDGQKILI